MSCLDPEKTNKIIKGEISALEKQIEKLKERKQRNKNKNRKKKPRTSKILVKSVRILEE